MSLEGVTEGSDDFRFFVGDRQFLWLWQERVDPKKARVPNPKVLVARVADDVRKQMRLQMDKNVFFTEPHYDGYNAVLVHLPKIKTPLLREVIAESWEVMRSASPARRRRQASTARRGRRPGSHPG
jgi:hypothetical protein